MKKIMVIDNDQRTQKLLSTLLSPFYRCLQFQTATDAIEFLLQKSVSLVILDVVMPGMQDSSICTEIRKFSNVPIIILSSKREKEDIVNGFKQGADDYLTMPFNKEELLVRVEALIKRASIVNSDSLFFQGLTWDKTSFNLSFNGKSISITPKEFALVGHLLRNPNSVFSRGALLETIWKHEWQTESRTIDSHIRNIREKLRLSGFPVDLHLKTVWGVGYKWETNHS
ncbi:response regulator transcription factor (plasmid) [Cytobacillus firmus]|uniref:response regulator transcription factor n=1 Tax=Cytobacillus firmus TaxID=1399 RepID=UPI002079DBE5|nr:response regulator transcription factor [Cytobacillus firmus]USK41575.1 response regulator transcription factor [Cytobacillus firmus]